MKIALLADIHGNFEALQACLAHAERAGAGKLIFLGDLVGYGADPVACLRLLAEHAGKGALLIRGNHDEAVLGGLCENMNPVAREAAYWTRAQLGGAERDFLSSLPLTALHNDLFLVHASADKPDHWSYINTRLRALRCMDAAGAEVTIAGHMHSQMLYWRSEPAQGSFTAAAAQGFVPTPGVPIPLTSRRRWLAIVGSVGQPRDGCSKAAYALFDDAVRTLCFFRVSYDHETAARKIVAAGLPESLARRLHQGE